MVPPKQKPMAATREASTSGRARSAFSGSVVRARTAAAFPRNSDSRFMASSRGGARAPP